MLKNTELTLSKDKIKKLIEQANLAKPYTDKEEEYDCLDGKIDGLRGVATIAKKMLDRYFANHPEDNIENYKN